MRPIGGYFSLELMRGESFHPNALALNTGRNCLEFILRCRVYRKVFVPYYTCSVVLEPIQKIGLEYSFYHINRQLEITEEITLNDDEALIYTNYFGLKQDYVKQLAKHYRKQLIVDNTQAFFSKPIEGIDTFYTCRKFFGVPDGAYLYTDVKSDIEIKRDVSYNRMSFLLKRLDLGPEAGYADFREQSKRLAGQPIRLMSNLTDQIMRSVDYDRIALRRRENYLFLSEHLSDSNLMNLTLDDDAVPMVYPYFTDDKGLKQRLIAEKIYVATYWPNVFEWCNPDVWEYRLAEQTIFIPVDQRYEIEDMKLIIEIIKH